MANDRMFIEIKKAIHEALEPSKIKVKTSKINVTPKIHNLKPVRLRRIFALNNLL